MKKLLALLLAALMIFTVSACSNKDDGSDKNLDSYVKEDEDDITFVKNDKGQTFHFESIDSETVKLTKYEGPSDPHDLVIPNTLNDKTVTTIGAEAFYFCSAIKTVSIPPTVDTIEAEAFSGCSLLSAVEIPASVTSIGEAAFSRCTSLVSVTFAAASEMEGREVVLKNIEQYTFNECTALESITIPSYIDTIGSGAFFGCESLATVTVESDGENGVEIIGTQAFQGCTALASLTLSDTIVEFGKYVFHDCDALYLDGVHCPEGSYAAEYIDSLDLDETAPVEPEETESESESETEPEEAPAA